MILLFCALLYGGGGGRKKYIGEKLSRFLKKRGGVFLGHSLVIIKLTLVIFSQNLQLHKLGTKECIVDIFDLQ